MKFADSLFPTSFNDPRDVTFLQVSPPGRVFEDFDKERERFVMTTNAFLLLLDFLNRNFQKTLDQMSPRVNPFEARNPGERVDIGNNFFIESEGGVVQKQVLEERKEYKLYITFNYQSIPRRTFVFLQYEKPEKSDFIEIPVTPALKMASQIEQIKYLFRVQTICPPKKRRV